jgi:transposase
LQFEEYKQTFLKGSGFAQKIKFPGRMEEKGKHEKKIPINGLMVFVIYSWLKTQSIFYLRLT